MAEKNPATEKVARSVNNILRAFEKLQRDSRPLDAKQKTKVLAAIDGAIAETKSVLSGKATAKAGFSLDEETPASK